MSPLTRTQKLSKGAFAAVDDRTPLAKEYASFAKSFPALIHRTGLCQAVAFAASSSKHSKTVLSDVVRVVGAADAAVGTVDELTTRSRQGGVVAYLRLSRLTLDAATWVKRYVEALDVTEKAATAPSEPGITDHPRGE